jgi:hypothetical protein
MKRTKPGSWQSVSQFLFFPRCELVTDEPLLLFRCFSFPYLVDPSKDPEAQGDPFTTLFLSRLDYSVTEKDLQREFEMYGPIARIRVVTDKNGKSKGYAFIVYEKERDMRCEGIE